MISGQGIKILVPYSAAKKKEIKSLFDSYFLRNIVSLGYISQPEIQWTENMFICLILKFKNTSSVLSL